MSNVEDGLVEKEESDEGVNERAAGGERIILRWRLVTLDFTGRTQSSHCTA